MYMISIKIPYGVFSHIQSNNIRLAITVESWQLHSPCAPPALFRVLSTVISCDKVANSKLSPLANHSPSYISLQRAT